MRIIFCFWFFLFGFVAFGQNDTAYYSYFGGDKSEQLIDIIDNNDGTFSILGFTSSLGNGSTDIIIFEIDTNLRLLNEFVIGTEYIEKPTGFIKENNRYYISGFTDAWGNGQYDGYLVKTDILGNILFEKAIGGDSWDELLGIEYSNGYITVLSNEISEDTLSYLLYGFDTLGNEFTNFELPNSNIIYSDIFPDDSSFFVSGKILENAKENVYLANYHIFNNKFKLRFSNSYDFDENQRILKGKVIDNEVFLIGESNFISKTDNYDVYLASYSALDGSFNWSSHYGSSTIGNDYGTDITKYNGQLFLCGTTNSYGQGQNDFYPLILSETGSFIDGTTFGNERDEWAGRIIKTPNWLYIFGSSEDQGIAYEDILVIKTQGFVPFPPRKYSKVYFNGNKIVNHVSEIDISNKIDYTSVKVYNLLGQEIYSGKSISNLKLRSNQIIFVKYFNNHELVRTNKTYWFSN